MTYPIEKLICKKVEKKIDLVTQTREDHGEHNQKFIFVSTPIVCNRKVHQLRLSKPQPIT